MPIKKYTDNQYIKAELIFILTGKPLEEIANEVGVTLSTVRNWSSKNKWQEKSDSYQYSLENVVTRCLYQLKELNAKYRSHVQPLSHSDIDAVYKLVKTILTCQEEITIPNTKKVLEEFKYYLLTNNASGQEETIKQMEQFMNVKIDQLTTQTLYIKSVKFNLTKNS